MAVNTRYVLTESELSLHVVFCIIYSSDGYYDVCIGYYIYNYTLVYKCQKLSIALQAHACCHSCIPELVDESPCTSSRSDIIDGLIPHAPSVCWHTMFHI